VNSFNAVLLSTRRKSNGDQRVVMAAEWAMNDANACASDVLAHAYLRKRWPSAEPPINE
jgi:hypothetical protein